MAARGKKNSGKAIFSHSQRALSRFIIKFPYNARFDWLKQRTLSENKEQVNDIKLAFKFFAAEFRQI